MVTVRYYIRECPVCHVRYSSSLTPRNANVQCTGPDHAAIMKFVKEVYV